MAVGKTALADYLCENFGYVKYAFATPMKELEKIHQRFKIVEDISIEQLRTLLSPYVDKLELPAAAMDELIELYVTSPLILPKNREFLQKLGTDVVRKFNSSAWSDYVINDIKNIDKPVVVDDVRFPDEAEVLKSKGFFMVRMTSEEDIRIELIGKLYGEEALNPLRFNHPSETLLDEYNKFDLFMHNNYDDRLKSYASALNIYLSARGR